MKHNYSNTINCKLQIIIISKIIDIDLINTLISVKNNLSILDEFELEKINIIFLLGSGKENSFFNEFQSLLDTIAIKYKLIIQKSNGIYNAFNEALQNVKNNPYVWFLNSGDYAKNYSIKRILNILENPSKSDFEGVCFFSEISTISSSFLKPSITKLGKNKKIILSMLPCHQGVILKKQNYNKGFNSLGDEQRILKKAIMRGSIGFNSNCLVEFNYGGISTSFKISSKRRIHNIILFLNQKRLSTVFSESIKLIYFFMPLKKLSNILFISFTELKNNFKIFIFSILKNFKFFHQFFLIVDDFD